MHVYYLDEPLSPEEESDLSEMLEVEIEQVRIPHLLPAPDEHMTLEAALAGAEDAAVCLPKAAGILKDVGQRVGLVIPIDMLTYGGFSETIFALTGHYPFAIQTARHRETKGAPGSLRVFDMHGMMTE
jgi:hypothetical protein